MAPRIVPAGNSFEDIFGGAGGVLPGGYGDALRSIGGADYPVWGVQLRMSYPLGRSADSRRPRAGPPGAAAEPDPDSPHRTADRQRDHRRGGSHRVHPGAHRGPRRASRELAEEQLQAEESKFETGLSTNFYVLQSQRDLAAARDAELRAILDYQRALIDFDRAQRASLGAAGIAVVGGATLPGAQAPESRLTPGTSVSSGR